MRKRFYWLKDISILFYNYDTISWIILPTEEFIEFYPEFLVLDRRKYYVKLNYITKNIRIKKNLGDFMVKELVQYLLAHNYDTIESCTKKEINLLYGKIIK